MYKIASVLGFRAVAFPIKAIRFVSSFLLFIDQLSNLGAIDHGPDRSSGTPTNGY
jgi:hypothetical protein